MVDPDELTDIEWLELFEAQWHILADLSFSDLLLWLPSAGGEQFTCVGQVRPVTGPTALEEDVLGEVLQHEPGHQVVAAYLSEEIVETSDNELYAGIPVDVWAVPILRNGQCIAVLERHTNQMGVRATGALEEHYLEAANVLTDMLMSGNFPLAPAMDRALAPRVGDGVIRVGSDRIITYASPNAITAFRRLGAIGDLEGENFSALARSVKRGVESMGQTLESDLRQLRSVVFDIEQARSAARVVVLPLDVDGTPLGALVLCRDITDLRRRDQMLVTKDATIREIHHRIKNNLQTVAALLRMQSRRLKSEEGREALRDATRRVSSIAVVHDTLSHTIDDDLAFDHVCDRILRMVGDLAAADGTVDARRRGSFGVVSPDAATALAMVLTELCQNAIEHGLGGGSGTVEVVPERLPGGLQVDVLDSGGGLSEDFELGDQTSLGLNIIQTLIGDLGGSIRLEPRETTSGTRARIWLPDGA